MQRQRLSAFVASALLTTAALAIFAAPASACEPGYCIDSVVPEDGATDVPTDAKIWVFYDHTRGSDPVVTLEAVDGDEAIATTTEIHPGGQPVQEVPKMVAVVTPEQPLAADTSYRISFSGGAVCGSPDSPVEFTTGSSTAEAPAEFTDGIEISSSCNEAPEQLNSCNNGTLFPYVTFGLSADEPSAATAYAVYRGDEVISMAQTSPVVQMAPEDVEESSCFRLARLNIAGEQVLHDLDACPSLPAAPACQPDGASDAGGGDAGPDAGDTGDSADADGDTSAPGNLSNDVRTDVVGCGCASSAESPPVTGLLLCALLLVGVRLRRRDRARR